jgi:hypothetical protein
MPAIEVDLLSDTVTRPTSTQGDLRRVMALMGHADLASTMRYLRPASHAQVQYRVNAVKSY